MLTNPDLDPMPSAAQSAADFIAMIDISLANMFLAQPFRRMQIANAFAAGLQNDTMNMGLTIITLAEIDRDDRLNANSEAVPS